MIGYVNFDSYTMSHYEVIKHAYYTLITINTYCQMKIKTGCRPECI